MLGVPVGTFVGVGSVRAIGFVGQLSEMSAGNMHFQRIQKEYERL